MNLILPVPTPPRAVNALIDIHIYMELDPVSHKQKAHIEVDLSQIPLSPATP